MGTMEAKGRLEFNSICRLCIQLLEAEKVSPIFNNEVYAGRVTLPERIRYCSSVEVCEGDGLPNKICSTCLSKLNQSFVFRNQCVLADNTLKRLIRRDVTLSSNEMHEFTDVDLENDVVQREEISAKRNACGAFDASQDEFETVCEIGRINEDADSSKDCPDVRSPPRSEEVFLERKSRRKKLVKCRKKKGEESSESEDGSGNERGRSKSRRSKRPRGKKSDEEEVQVKEEIKEEVEDAVESFTVEPDVFEFAGESGGPKKEADDAPRRDDVQRRGRKEKIGMKRGRPRKYSVVKEKPSSYTCDYCHKVYPSEGGWRYHIHTMHNENYQPFICDLCGKAFKVKKNLEGHKNSIHYHLKHHLCDVCGRGFASKYALKVHKIWHNDEKNFPCDVCGTKFRTRGKMNTHRSVHGGPKKFMCHVCSRDFRWKKDFEIHMRTHTGEKPFKCSHCGKAFSSLTNMKKHERNHAGKLRTIRTGSEAFATDMPASTVDDDDILYDKVELPFQYGCPANDSRSRGDFD